MLKVIITGGSGFLGEIIAQHFINKKYQVTIISRSKPSFSLPIEWAKWDGETLGEWVKTMDGSDILINLAGKSVNCRYTPKAKEELMYSRVNSTKVIGEAFNIISSPPKIWFNASSATIFANNGKRSGENEIQGEGFSSDICRAWEKALYSVETPLTRKIALRLGLVMDEKGDLISYFKNIIKTGFGGPMGSGEQHISWLHYKDLLAAIDFMIDSSIDEPINLVSPTPTKNKDFMKAFRSQMKFPIGIPNASWMVKLGAAVVGTEAELVLYDRQVIPEKLVSEGFQFKFDEIKKALKDLI